jgi:phosphate transport system protein
MPRFFHSELDTLKSQLVLMGELAVDAIEQSVRSLIKKDFNLARKVIEGDDAIDNLEMSIDHEATRYLTLRAPVATDLRLITVAIKASHDLERVGDEARNVAKRVRKLLMESSVAVDFHRLEEMGRMTRDMIEDALRCLINEDPDSAANILAADAEIDRLNDEHMKHFVDLAKDSPNKIDQYLDLIFVSKSLERIADHATNLAEEVIFLTTAQDTRHR